MITADQAAEAFYEWLGAHRGLVAAGAQLSNDPALERAAVSVLYDMARGHADAWQTAPQHVRGLASMLVVDFLMKLIGKDPTFTPHAYDAPAELKGAALGAWIVRHEIERAHPWLVSGAARH